MPLFCRIFLLTLALMQLSAQAQSDATTTDDFFADSPLILTASRMAKPLLESPASVSVIDREMIEASGMREVADLFRLVPGFVVGYHGGQSPVVTYHGLGREFGNKIQVLIDGRSVFIPSFGGVPWSNLPLLIEDIERIEVIRGPNAVTYGANAFLATINIITRHAAEDIGTSYSVTASDNANPDIEDSYLRIGHQHGAVDWRLSLGTFSDGGFAAVNDSRRTSKANFRMDLGAGSNQLWTLQLGTSDSRAGRGFPPSSGATTDIERSEEVQNSYFNLQWEAVWDSSTTIARLTHTQQEVIDHFDPGPFTFNGINNVTTFIDFDRVSNRTDLEFIQTDDVGDSVRLVYGGSLRQDKVKSLFLLNDNSYHNVDTQRVFGGIEWRIDDNWLLDLGVMLEDSDLTSMEDSPRISLIRKFGGNHALRLVASAAKRNPILYEHDGATEFMANVPGFGTVIVPTWMGNSDIEPEDIESYEIGLHSQLASGFETDIKLFSYEISKHIVAAETEVLVPPFGLQDVDTSANAESSKVRGVEIGVGYTGHEKVGFNAGFSLVDAKATNENFEKSIPDYTAFISVLYRINRKHEVSSAFYYQDEITWLDGTSDVPISRRLDLRYSYHLNNELNIELIGQNLLEDFEDYEEENVHDQVIYLRLSGGF
ncbi:MAG: TonB-dependent receptor [Gammaproteobacteria bacterium]|nr:TonB-dependent receptor [Gammaproteobacteria bacterium]